MLRELFGFIISNLLQTHQLYLNRQLKVVIFILIKSYSIKLQVLIIHSAVGRRHNICCATLEQVLTSCVKRLKINPFISFKIGTYLHPIRETNKLVYARMVN